MSTEFIDLITVSGELIRIECPDEHCDELYETLDNAKKRGDWWSVGQFDGCKAEYLGNRISRFSMKDVIGFL